MITVVYTYYTDVEQVFKTYRLNVQCIRGTIKVLSRLSVWVSYVQSLHVINNSFHKHQNLNRKFRKYFWQYSAKVFYVYNLDSRKNFIGCFLFLLQGYYFFLSYWYLCLFLSKWNLCQCKNKKLLLISKLFVTLHNL